MNAALQPLCLPVRLHRAGAQKRTALALVYVFVNTSPHPAVHVKHLTKPRPGTHAAPGTSLALITLAELGPPQSHTLFIDE